MAGRMPLKEHCEECFLRQHWFQWANQTQGETSAKNLH